MARTVCVLLALQLSAVGAADGPHLVHKIHEHAKAMRTEFHEKLPASAMPKAVPSESAQRGSMDILQWLSPLPFFEGHLASMAGGFSFLRVIPHQHVHEHVDQDRVADSHPLVGKDGEIKPWVAILASVLSTLSSLVFWVFSVFVVGFIYQRFSATQPVDVDRAKIAFKDKPFAHGPFSCFEDMEVCCWSFWCGGIRWADTMNATGIMAFWLALTLFLAVQTANAVFGLLVWVVVSLMFTYYRQELRRVLDMRNETKDALADFAMWCCCACCAVAQEARQVKLAHKIVASNVV